MTHTPQELSSSCSVNQPELTETVVEERNQVDFLNSLVRALDENGVRYCVLHSWEGLPGCTLSSDLDVVVHPKDVEKMPFVFRALDDRGYCPVQCVNYSVNGYAFTFLWVQGKKVAIVILDVSFDHRAAGIRLQTGEALLSDRRKEGVFWVASPAAEFSYLLAKKAGKASVSMRQAGRLRQLLEQVGCVEAERIGNELFGRRWGQRAIQACADESINELLCRLRPQMWLTSFARQPLQGTRCLFEECLRLARRWLHPTGMFVVILGPDGSGKTTLARYLLEVLKPAFYRQRLAHWRPGLLSRSRPEKCVIDPHGLPTRGWVASTGYLLAFFLDNIFGFFLVMRPLLTRSALVCFDRSFEDVIVDSKRYRYGGPTWLPRFLASFVPPRDKLLFVLDAPEQVILSRKNDVALKELQHQRHGYRRLASDDHPEAKLLETDQGLELTLAQALQFTVAYLVEKFRRQHSRWLAHRQSPACGSTLVSNSDDVLELALRSVTAPSVEQKRDCILPSPPSGYRDHTVSFAASRQHRRKLDAEGYRLNREFVILPARSAPRWLLPIGKPAHTVKGLEIYSPHTRTARILKSVACAAFRSGWAGFLGDRVLVSSSGPLLLENLVAELTGEWHPEFVLSLGTPGRFRKLTVQVMDRNRLVLGYIKLPLTQPANDRIRHEAAILKRFEDSALRNHVPRLLYSGPWNEGYILFESALKGLPGPTALRLEHYKVLKKMRDIHFVSKPGSVIVEEVGERWRKVVPQLGRKWSDIGTEVLCRCAQTLRSTSLPCGLIHGDFTPWNTKFNSGELLLFDWESAEEEAPLEWDLFHFQVQTASLLHKKESPSEKKDVSTACYLLYLLYSVTCFFSADGQSINPAIDYREKLAREQLGHSLGMQADPLFHVA